MTADVRTFQRRPVEVKAVQVTEDNLEAVLDWMSDEGCNVGATLRGGDTGPARHIWWVDDAQSWEAWPGAYIVREGRDFASFGTDEFLARYSSPAMSVEKFPQDEATVNPLHQVGVLRTRTDALARETEAAYRESLRLAQVCDRQQAELHRLRMAEPVELEAVFQHCAGCPGDHPTTPVPDRSAPVRDERGGAS